jgi:hypothetical protein
MAIDSQQFLQPQIQAYSGFDFSPLARLGQLAQQRQDQQGLANLAARSGYGAVADQSQVSPTGYGRSGGPVTSGEANISIRNRNAPFTGDKQAVAQQVTQELKAQGFSDNAIAGILYNIGQESSFNPTLRHPDQPAFGGEAHYAHGLFQEGGDEYNMMAAHMGNQNLYDPLVQTRYVVGRLKGEIGNPQYGDVMRSLQAAKTPEEAAKIFARGYLKPADQYLASRISDINRGIPSIGFYTGQ